MIISQYFSKTYDWCRAAVCDDARTSLLSRAESDGIKGFLILLIVLGHNKYVMQGGMSNVFLYSFHVYAFYYLPFLYDYRQESWKRMITKNLRRLYVPYTLIFLLLMALAYMQGTLGDLADIGVAYVCGSQYALSQSFGMGSFLWFIPTMFMVLIYRKIFYVLKSNEYRSFLLLLSVICWFGYGYIIAWFIPTWWFAPICCTTALAMVFPAILLRHFCQKINCEIGILLYFILSLLMMIFYPLRMEYFLTYLTINRFLSPVIIFLLIFLLKHYLIKSKLIINFGQKSFRIYIVHIFIYNFFYFLMDPYNPGIYEGIVLFFITFTISYLISKLSILRFIFLR